MSSEDFKIFLEDLADCIADVLNALIKLKEQIGKLLGVGEVHLINAPAPCSTEDPVIKWLYRKCDEVKAKHPESTWNWLISADGKIMGLRVTVPDPEVLADYESLAKWAFEKASQRKEG